MKFLLSSTLLLSALLAQDAAAEAHPDLYPNAHLKKVGPQQSQSDIRGCSADAHQYLNETSQERGAAREGVRGAARGAAVGALAGAITKNNVGRSAGAGAAIGGLHSGVSTARENRAGSPEYRKFVEACLEDKGYKVVGWR